MADAKIGTTAVVKVLRNGKPVEFKLADRLDVHVAAATLTLYGSAVAVKNADRLRKQVAAPVPDTRCSFRNT